VGSTVVRPDSPFSALAVEQVCKVLADAVTGAQIPDLLVPLRFNAAQGDGQFAKWKRLLNAVAAKQILSARQALRAAS
jgi:hypothetical protein